MNSILSSAAARALPAKAKQAKAPSAKQAKGAKAPKAGAKKAEAKAKAPKAAKKAEPKGPTPMTVKALNAVADKLADKFIGAHEIVEAKETVEGVNLILDDGSTVVLEMRLKK